MNALIISTATSLSSANVKGLIIEFIIAVLILAAIGGLIWCIERWIHVIPDPGKLLIAIILVVFLILWVVMNFF